LLLIQNIKIRLKRHGIALVEKYGPRLIEEFGSLVIPLLLDFKNENDQLLVFCFHGLFDTKKQKDLNYIDPQKNMTVRQFVDFIEYFLKNKYKFIKPEDLLGDLKNDQQYAMITFDDGYFNNMLAINILNDYKIPAVFFISTKNVNENKSFWWDIIYKFRIKQGSSIEAIRNEQRSLKSFKYAYIDNYIAQNFGIEAFKPWSDIDRPFSESEIKNLSKSPYISFGNHTHNHSILTNYDKEEIKEELRESNKILFDLTGTLPISIAFPNGNYNKLVVEVTEEAGFRYAFTTDSQKILLPLKQENLICLNRFMTNTSKIKKFGSFCRFGYNPELFYNDLKEKIKAGRLNGK